MASESASTRLRRTFAYPTESDDEDTVEAGMDAQEVVNKLATQDTKFTHTYTHLLLGLPLLPIPLYAPLLFHSAHDFAAAFLAITSLLATAYALYFLPLPPVKISVLDMDEVKKNGGGKKEQRQEAQASRRPVPFLAPHVADALAAWIVTANGALCSVLAVFEALSERTWSEGYGVGGGYLPGLVFVVVMFARRELREVDLSELEILRQGGLAKGM